MITAEEVKSKTFPSPMPTMGQTDAQVSTAEMRRFGEDYDELALMVSDLLDDYAHEHHIKPKYEGLEELTHLSQTTLKHVVNGRDRVTRTILYKLAVGLGLSIEKANMFFEKCGGRLREDCLEDYICLRAIEDGDTVVQFIYDYNHYTRGARLKELYV